MIESVGLEEGSCIDCPQLVCCFCYSSKKCQKHQFHQQNSSFPLASQSLKARPNSGIISHQFFPQKKYDLLNSNGKCQMKRVNVHNALLLMNNKLPDSMDQQQLLFRLYRVASKDEDARSPEFNPEDAGEGEVESVWRTNLMIEGEEERHNEAVMLCRITSIEDNLRHHHAVL